LAAEGEDVAGAGVGWEGPLDASSVLELPQELPAAQFKAGG